MATSDSYKDTKDFVFYPVTLEYTDDHSVFETIFAETDDDLGQWGLDEDVYFQGMTHDQALMYRLTDIGEDWIIQDVGDEYTVTGEREVEFMVDDEDNYQPSAEEYEEMMQGFAEWQDERHAETLEIYPENDDWSSMAEACEYILGEVDMNLAAGHTDLDTQEWADLYRLYNDASEVDRAVDEGRCEEIFGGQVHAVEQTCNVLGYDAERDGSLLAWIGGKGAAQAEREGKTWTPLRAYNVDEVIDSLSGAPIDVAVEQKAKYYSANPTEEVRRKLCADTTAKMEREYDGISRTFYESSLDAQKYEYLAMDIERMREVAGHRGDESDLPWYEADRLMYGKSEDDILQMSEDALSEAFEVYRDEFDTFATDVENAYAAHPNMFELPPYAHPIFGEELERHHETRLIDEQYDAEQKESQGSMSGFSGIDLTAEVKHEPEPELFAQRESEKQHGAVRYLDENERVEPDGHVVQDKPAAHPVDLESRKAKADAKAAEVAKNADKSKTHGDMSDN